MDERTARILKAIHLDLIIKKYLISFCYFSIICGVLFYAVQTFVKTSDTIKLVNKYQDAKEKYEVEKIMTNPRIDFKYNESDIYKIQAKKAFHKNEEEILLFNVAAQGEIGSINAGQLKIYENGQRLEFSGNPVLILNKTKNVK